MKIMKNVEFHARLTKKKTNYRIPYENYENHENHRIAYENPKNNKTQRIQCECHENHENS